jgi:carboxymethylenebutenolidase
MKSMSIAVAGVMAIGGVWLVASGSRSSAPGADPHAGHVAATDQAPQAKYPPFTRPANERIPPGIEQAEAALKASKQKNEWVNIAYSSGPAIKSWVAYPAKAEKAPVVIVIMEIFGLQDWIRGVADQLAEDGYIAIAPDLLSGMGPGGGGTAEIGGPDEARKVITSLTPAEAANRLRAVRQYAAKLPQSSGRTASVGFCWGGSRSFEFAIADPALNAAVVFYGSSPQNVADYAKITAPILGLYGSDDARVNATIEPAAAELKKLGKSFEYALYEGAGHGFLRAQQDRGGANYKASEEAWPRVLAFLQKNTR